MRKLILLSILILAGSLGLAQSADYASPVGEKPPVYSAYVAEIVGNGGLYSLNYERSFSPFIPWQLRWRAGLSVFPRGSLWTLTLPVSITKYWSTRRNDVFFFGTGQTLILSNTKGGYVRGTFRAGYRGYFKENRLFIEAAYTPFYSYLYNFQWDNWFGVSIGWRLKSKES